MKQSSNAIARKLSDGRRPDKLAVNHEGTMPPYSESEIAKLCT